MGIYQDLMGQIEDAGLLFNVQEMPVIVNGKAVPNKKALVNSKSDAVMSIVSDRYKVVTNEEIFSGFCNAIAVSGVDSREAKVNVKQTDSGERAMVDFIFPNHQISVGDDESRTALQLCALNSFDGSLRYTAKAGGFRMKCLNGQLLGSIVGSYSSTHTAKLDVDVGAAQVIRMIEEFNKAQDYWAAMMREPCSTNVALKVIMQFLNIKGEARQNYSRNDGRRNVRLDHCIDLWHQYRSEMGDNVYALYNVLTDYVSRPIKDSKNPARATIRQRARLEKIIDRTLPDMEIFSYDREAA